MNAYRFVTALTFFLLGGGLLCAQSLNIGGIINSYYPVTEVSCNYVRVTNASGLDTGNRVLIIQMKGALADSSNSASFGFPFTFNSCGNYEFAYIKGISGDRISLRAPLLRQYDPFYKVQLVKVPVYEQARLVTDVRALDWNGSMGGVVALEVKGDLLLNGHNILASGAGFSGGAAGAVNPGLCVGCINRGDYATTYTNNPAGYKGEGVFLLKNPMHTGTAPLINGGGGGNCYNGGGGGGSNGGGGGRGGMSSNECGAPDERAGGRGGQALSYDIVFNRVFLGGGGGGGNQDNSPLTGSSGGRGGGIIYIKAGRITSDSGFLTGAIRADGRSAGNATGEGAGGGGAGGTILLDASSLFATLSALGGNGGSTSTGRDSLCYAPGGGGGGGTIWYTSKITLINDTALVRPGRAGILDGLYSVCGGTSYGAEDGLYGRILGDLYIPENFPVPDQELDLGNDTFICENKNVTFDAGPNRKSYLWHDGSTTRTFTTSQPGQVTVEMVDQFGCLWFDTAQVRDESVRFNLGNDTTVCPGTPVTFVPKGGYKRYTWFDGLNQAARTFSAGGSYWLEVESDLGCIDKDTVVIANKVPYLYLGPDTVICEGRSLLLDAGSGYPSYLWKYGKTGRYYGCSFADTIWVTAPVMSGCTVSDTIVVSFVPGRQVHLGNDTTTCIGVPLHLKADTGFAGYEWNNGFTDQVIEVRLPGTYIVKTTDTNQCRSADTIVVSQAAAPDTLYIPAAFSPNSNGINDFFPYNYNEASHVTDFEMALYNRWGEKVFRSAPGNLVWDGQYMGSYAETGMYLYVIKWRKCNGDYEIRKGTFLLYR